MLGIESQSGIDSAASCSESQFIYGETRGEEFGIESQSGIGNAASCSESMFANLYSCIKVIR